MLRYVRSHIRGAFEVFALEITGKVIFDIVFDGQSQLIARDLFIYGVIAFIAGAGRWPLLDSDDAMLRITPDENSKM